jgi:hypothetical protein
VDRTVGDQPLGAPNRFLHVRQAFVDIGAERLECEELFRWSARNQTFDPSNRIFCSGQASFDVNRRFMQRAVGDQPLCATKGFLDLRQAFVDIGAERLEREELFGRSARNHTLNVSNRVFGFREPGGDASRQLMEGTVGNEPFGARKRFLRLYQPLIDAGADCLDRRHRVGVHP